ncbi:MAG TPA: STAS domain-containing protein [Terriglobales bacterium]|nr:STAS domain-containing protein [Terriglobales bacterium]
METSSRPVVVKRMPERMNLKQARTFLKEVEPFLTSDRPQVVFDMSQVRQIDAAGVEVLLQCMREASKHDGDLKLAALSPQAAIVLELTRAGRLFEIYENSTAAVKSFSCFLPNAIRHVYAQPAETTLPMTAAEPPMNPDPQGGAELAA